jgi:hypothetical protein
MLKPISFKTGQLYQILTENKINRGISLRSSNKYTRLLSCVRRISFRSPSLFYLLDHSRCRGFLFSLDHTQTHTTVGRTPLDEGSASRRDLYLATQTLYRRQTSMPPVRFEPTVPASARPQTYALDRAATGIGIRCICDPHICFGKRTAIFRELFSRELQELSTSKYRVNDYT